MDSLTVYFENKEQLRALTEVMEAMNIAFEYNRLDKYPSHVLNGLSTSLKQADNGDLIPYTGINDMLGKLA
jgi:hypothetical protein